MHYLSSKVYKITEFQSEFKEKWGVDSTKTFRYLESKNFVKIISNPDKDEKWVVLKTAIELKPIFPEYLIRIINQQMVEKKMDKDFALTTLNYMKKCYLELEKPDLLKKYLDKIAHLEKSIKEHQSASESGKKSDQKMIQKSYKEILDLYRQIGDLDAIAKTEKLVRNLND
jgi:hypothetical protein